MISFGIHRHNSYNNSVLGIHPKTSQFPNIFLDHERHPLVRGTATCIGPESMDWFESHNLFKRSKNYQQNNKS